MRVPSGKQFSVAVLAVLAAGSLGAGPVSAARPGAIGAERAPALSVARHDSDAHHDSGAPGSYGAPGRPFADSQGHDDGYAYRLPYGDAVSFSVLQAYGSQLSHRGSEYYTVDFGMPEGTPVHSAREGQVLATEDGFDRSCWTADCGRYANFVEIRHPDGTIGRYFHLQQGSVLVEPGQWVGRGEPIARSGDTGYASVPHLHFGVYRLSDAGEAQSIAVRFVVRGGRALKPRTGARYINEAEN